MNEEIALRLKVYRIYRNITQEKVAEDLNISRSKVSSWESCRRDMSITDAIMLANYLGVSMDNLFNPVCLNSNEFCEIAKRYFKNDKITLEEKNEILKKLFEYRTTGEISELFDESKWHFYPKKFHILRRIMYRNVSKKDV